MKKVLHLLIALFMVSSCAWFKTEPKVEPEPITSEEEMMRAEHERKLVEAETYVGEGITFYQKGQDSSAIKSWDKALQIIPEDSEVHNFKGMALHRTGNSSIKIT